MPTAPATGQNPLDDFRTWYAAQEEEIRGELAASVLRYHPVPVVPESPLRELTAARELFAAWLGGEAGQRDRTVGKLLHVRSVVEWALVRCYGREGWWEEMAERTRERLARSIAAQDFALAEIDHQSLRSLEARRMRWRAACSSWRLLHNTSMSSEVIELYAEQRGRP